MGVLFRWLIASCFTIALAIILSVIPDLELKQQELNNGNAVFYNMKTKILDRHNVVDSLINLSLRLSIDRVEWKGSFLSLDMIASLKDGDSRYVYEDMRKIIDFGLLETSNVQGVLIRVLSEDQTSERKQLLVAAEGWRKSLTSAKVKSLRRSELTAEQYLNSQFSMTYTKLWENRRLGL